MMAVTVIRRKGGGEDGLVIDVEISGAAGTQQQAVPAFGKGHHCGRTQEEWHVAFATHAGVHILLRYIEEAEDILRVGFSHLGRLSGPGVGVWHTFLCQLHEHAACGHLLFGDGWGRRHKLVFRLQHRSVDGAAVDGHVIEPAIEGMRGCERGAAADHEGVAIGHGGAVSGAAHVPHAVRFTAIDVAFDALGFAVGVGDGDVVPAGGGQGVLGPPAVPVAFFVGHIGAAEEEADLRAAFGVLQAEGVVLILAAKFLGAEAALADDVGRAALIGGLHPGFEGDGIIEAKAQFLAVLDGEGGFFAVAVEAAGGVVLGKAGVGRRARAGVLGVVKAPLHDRGGGQFIRTVVAAAVILGGGDSGEQECG